MSGRAVEPWRQGDRCPAMSDVLPDVTPDFLPDFRGVFPISSRRSMLTARSAPACSAGSCDDLIAAGVHG